MNVMAIGAHPDDVELGCGGTLLRHVSKGDDVDIIVVTKGEAQTGVQWRDRQDEALEASKMIGAGLFCLALEERDVCYVDHKLVGLIREVVAKTRPKIVYCHSDQDDHQTHVAVARATVAACKLENVPTILMYEVPSTRWSFVPSMLVNITDYMEGKLAALNCFASQTKRYYMLAEMIVGLARTRAYEARVGPDSSGRLHAAEAFQVERMVVS